MEIDHADPQEPHLHHRPRPQPRPRRQTAGPSSSSRLEEQKQLLQNPSYVRTVQRWTGKGDERRQVEKQQRVRPWWRTDAAGHLVMSVFYGTKPIEFEKGKAGIAVASRDKLPALIDALIGAAKAGELDELMARLGKPVGAPKAARRPDPTASARAAVGVARASSPTGHDHMTRRRGRPPGTSGRAAVLIARPRSGTSSASRDRGAAHAARAEAALAMSIGLGLRAKELAALTWADVYEAEGRVRQVVHLQGGLHQGREDARRVRVVAGAAARAGEVRRARLAAAARGPRRRRCSPARRAGR